MTNLIERLRERVASPFERPAVDQALMSEAATALSEAKAENERVTRERDKWFREAEERADACSLLIRERDGLREALTPSGDTKAAYVGEFSFNIEDYDEDGVEWARVVTVPWTTVKDIMAAIRTRALNPKGGDNGEG